MNNAVSKVLAFACDNPDYWELLRADTEPPEIAEMPPEDQEAIRAAIRDVQRSTTALLECVRQRLATKAEGTPLEGPLSKECYAPSFKRGALWFGGVATGPGKNASLSIRIFPDEDKVRLYVELTTVNARWELMRESIRAASGAIPEEDDTCFYLGKELVEAAKFEDLADDLVNWAVPAAIAFRAAVSGAPAIAPVALEEDANQDA